MFPLLLTVTVDAVLPIPPEPPTAAAADPEPPTAPESDPAIENPPLPPPPPIDCALIPSEFAP